jgi:hypothetical protein
MAQRLVCKQQELAPCALNQDQWHLGVAAKAMDSRHAPTLTGCPRRTAFTQIARAIQAGTTDNAHLDRLPQAHCICARIYQPFQQVVHSQPCPPSKLGMPSLTAARALHRSRHPPAPPTQSRVEYSCQSTSSRHKRPWTKDQKIMRTLTGCPGAPH